MRSPRLWNENLIVSCQHFGGRLPLGWPPQDVRISYFPPLMGWLRKSFPHRDGALAILQNRSQRAWRN